MSHINANLIQDINKITKFSRSKNIDFLKASPEIQQIIIDFYNTLNVSKPQLPPIGTTDDNPVTPPATIAAKVIKSSAPADGVYPFVARKSIYADKSVEYKIAIPSLKKEEGKYPCTGKLLDDNARQYIDNLYNDHKELFAKVKRADGRATLDTKSSVGQCMFYFNAEGSIKKISNIEWFVLEPQKAKPLKELKAFSVLISKSDPLLLNDNVLSAWGYYSNNTAPITNDEYGDLITGRIGEIVLHKKYLFLDWLNKDSERVNSFDFKTDNLTIDVKTTRTRGNNLTIKEKKVKDNTLADIYAFAFVEDLGSEFNVTFLGFIAKEDALQLICNKKAYLKSDIGSYLIFKTDLKSSINIDGLSFKMI